MANERINHSRSKRLILLGAFSSILIRVHGLLSAARILIYKRVRDAQAIIFNKLPIFEHFIKSDRCMWNLFSFFGPISINQSLESSTVWFLLLRWIIGAISSHIRFE